MNAQDVVRQAREADLRLVRFLYCDNGGIIRGKATHASKLPRGGKSIALRSIRSAVG